MSNWMQAGHQILRGLILTQGLGLLLSLLVLSNCTSTRNLRPVGATRLSVHVTDSTGRDSAHVATAPVAAVTPKGRVLRHQRQVKRIEARKEVKLAKEKTAQQKEAKRTETAQNKAEMRQKRDENAASVKLSKLETDRHQATQDVLHARAKAELQRATAEKARARADTMQLGLRIGGITLLVAFVVGAYLKFCR